MKSSFKVIDLSDGASSYTIGPSDNVSRILLIGGVRTLTQNISISWEGGNGNAPSNTMILIHKTASISLGAYNINLFGYNMPKDIAVYGDMIECVKLHSTLWKLTGYMGISFALAGIGIGGGGGIDPTDGLVGFGTKEINISLDTLVDGSTIKSVGGKLTANLPGDNKIVVLDDFIDDTNKVMTSAQIDTNSIGGVVKMTAELGGSYSSSLSDKVAQIGLSRSPEIASYFNIATRGNGLIMAGIYNDFHAPTRGAYFKLSGTSLEVFTVVNDGTERILTTGITLALNTNYKFSIQIDTAGKAKFYINNVVVREEASYSVPDALYAHNISIDGGTTDTIIFVDYMKLELSRT